MNSSYGNPHDDKAIVEIKNAAAKNRIKELEEIKQKLISENNNLRFPLSASGYDKFEGNTKRIIEIDRELSGLKQ